MSSLSVRTVLGVYLRVVVEVNIKVITPEKQAKTRGFIM